MKIGNIEFENEYILAPIAGYSDVGFRAVCKKYGVGLTVTEMVSAKGLNYGNKNTGDLLATTKGETPVAVQLFGSEPEHMFKASQNELLEKFDIIDINMGCPVRKIVGNGEGSALMKNPKLIEEVVRATVEGAKRPVTVKLRAGFEMDEPTALECGFAAQKGGAAAVAVHGRYREQFYSGRADWSVIANVKRALKIPVIANGDIVDIASAKECKAQTNCDGIMIARGALGRPYLFSQLQNKKTKIDTKKDILLHIDTLKQFLPEKIVANNMKMHLCYYAKGLQSPKAVRKALGDIHSFYDLMNAVDYFWK